MDVRSWSGPQLAAIWLVGLALAAAVLVAGRFRTKRVFDEVMREVETVGRSHGLSSASPSSTSAGSVQVLQSFHLPADSPDSLRIARAMRRLNVANGLFLSAALAVPLSLVALTAYWIWLKVH